MLESPFNKVTVLKACTLKESQAFSVNIVKLLRAPISKNICERLLLKDSRLLHTGVFVNGVTIRRTSAGVGVKNQQNVSDDPTNSISEKFTKQFKFLKSWLKKQNEKG